MNEADGDRSIYPEWFHLAESGNLGGIMVWSLGAQGLDLTVSLPSLSPFLILIDMYRTLPFSPVV